MTYYTYRLNFFTLLLLVLNLKRNLVSALPQEGGGVGGGGEPPSPYPTITQPPVAWDYGPTITTYIEPSHTPLIFLETKRGINVNSINQTHGNDDGRWGGGGKRLDTFVMDGYYNISEIFLAKFYEELEGWDRMTGPDPMDYRTWTTGSLKEQHFCTVKVTASPQSDITLTLSRTDIPIQTPVMSDVAQLQCN